MFVGLLSPLTAIFKCILNLMRNHNYQINNVTSVGNFHIMLEYHVFFVEFNAQITQTAYLSVSFTPCKIRTYLCPYY